MLVIVFLLSTWAHTIKRCSNFWPSMKETERQSGKLIVKPGQQGKLSILCAHTVCRLGSTNNQVMKHSTWDWPLLYCGLPFWGKSMQCLWVSLHVNPIHHYKTCEVYHMKLCGQVVNVKCSRESSVCYVRNVLYNGPCLWHTLTLQIPWALQIWVASASVRALIAIS